MSRKVYLATFNVYSALRFVCWHTCFFICVVPQTQFVTRSSLFSALPFTCVVLLKTNQTEKRQGHRKSGDLVTHLPSAATLLS